MWQILSERNKESWDFQSVPFACFIALFSICLWDKIYIIFDLYSASTAFPLTVVYWWCIALTWVQVSRCLDDILSVCEEELVFITHLWVAIQLYSQAELLIIGNKWQMLCILWFLHNCFWRKCNHYLSRNVLNHVNCLTKQCFLRFFI